MNNYNQSNPNEIHIKEINPIQYNTGMMTESKDQNVLRREYSITRTIRINSWSIVKHIETRIWINAENTLRATIMKK